MKRFLLILVMVILCTTAFARTITQNEAIQASSNWIHKYGNNLQVESTEVISEENGEPTIYLVRYEPVGFVYLTADTRAYPVIGYSAENSAEGSMPPALEMILEMHSESVSIIRSNNISNEPNEDIWQMMFDNTISPSRETVLLTMEGSWGQSGVYDDDCPVYNGNQSIAGCSAIAFAQIVNYFGKWSYTFTDNDDYTSTCADSTDSFFDVDICIDDAASIYSFPDFSTLNSSMASVVSTFDNNNSLTYPNRAALSFASGVLLQSTYGEDGTSAYTYDSNFESISYICTSMSSYSPTYAMSEEIVSSIDSDSPVWMSAARLIPNSSPPKYSGHAFNLAGYQAPTSTSMQVNVLWGWSGSYNGWFAIDTLEPFSGQHYDRSFATRSSFLLAGTLQQQFGIYGSTGNPGQFSVTFEDVNDQTNSFTELTDYAGYLDELIPEGTYDITVTHNSVDCFSRTVFRCINRLWGDGIP